MKSCCIYKPHLRAHTLPSSRWTTHKKISMIFCKVLFLFGCLFFKWFPTFVCIGFLYMQTYVFALLVWVAVYAKVCLCICVFLVLFLLLVFVCFVLFWFICFYFIFLMIVFEWEKQRVEIWVGEIVKKSWEKLSEGIHNQNILYKKSIFN